MQKITQYTPKQGLIECDELVIPPTMHLAVFDETIISFLNKVSRLLLSNKQYNAVPEIVALGFWLRRANLEAMRKENQYWLNSSQYSVNPIGRVFHVAPSNVDTIFLYSLCISLLMGNSNVVRISSARSSQIIKFIIDCINEALSANEFRILNEYIAIVTYGHEEDINSFFSANVNCRVIWGGDNTVLHFKGMPTRVFTRDIFFPNRVSYSIFNAGVYNKADSKSKESVAHDFYNDAYTFDQLGCSSPKVIFVIGSKDDKSKFVEEFYTTLDATAGKRYHGQASLLSVQKFNHLIDDVISKKVSKVLHNDNATYMLESNSNSIDLGSCYGGYFYIKQLENIEMLATMVSESVQTLTHFGLDENDMVKLNKALYGKRVDRIVPVGQALSFHYVWDGMNLFEALSRKRYIKN